MSHVAYRVSHIRCPSDTSVSSERLAIALHVPVYGTEAGGTGASGRLGAARERKLRNPFGGTFGV